MSDHPTSLWVACSAAAGDCYIPNKHISSPCVIIVDLLHARSLLATQRPLAPAANTIRLTIVTLRLPRVKTPAL